MKTAAEVKETIHRWTQFDADKDAELIAAGTHFYCHVHMTARPIIEKSFDPRYCQDCFDYLKKEMEYLPPGKNPVWVPRDGGEPILNPCGVKHHSKNDVTKIITQRNVPNRILLQGKMRGRPEKKAGETVCRMTLWRRRQKEKQGVFV